MWRRSDWPAEVQGRWWWLRPWCPISAYLALTPRFFVWRLFPVGVYLGAAAATRRHHRELGVALVVAKAAFFAWLAVTIFG